MANTADLEVAFDSTRNSLRERFGFTFSKRSVRLNPGGQRTFNAVSDDGSVVATISHSSGPTSGGKKPVGKVHAAVAYLFFLSQVEAEYRLLVLTDRSLFEIVEREVRGALPEGVEVIHLPLAPDVAARVRAVTKAAS